jgi:flagellar biogenesis protein FliO
MLKYFMGVFGIINSAVVQASEKFDLLPDLPDPLAYAVQPAVASTVSGAADTTLLGAQSVGHEPNILSVILSLIFVILLIYVTGIIYTKLNKVGYKTLKQQGELAKSQVSVISTTALGGNKTLHVVELDGKRMLIGASSSTIQLIKDLGSFSNTNNEEEYSHIEIPNIKIPKIEIPKIEIPSINFSKLVTKTHSPIKEVLNENEEEENLKDVAGSVYNSEVIINSLFNQQDNSSNEEEISPQQSVHSVDPEDFSLYKKYLV